MKFAAILGQSEAQKSLGGLTAPHAHHQRVVTKAEYLRTASDMVKQLLLERVAEVVGYTGKLL